MRPAPPRRSEVPCPACRSALAVLLDDRQDVLLGKDEVVDFVDLHLTAGVLRIHHAVADLDVEGNARTCLLVVPAAANRLDRALLRLLLRRVWKDDATLGHILALEGFDDDAIRQRA